MQSLSPELWRDLDEVARRHGVATETAQALLGALTTGGGTMAQFDIPELGGMGQWSQGGMTMVGDMFDQGLKARVADLCSDLASLMRGRPAQQQGATPGAGAAGQLPGQAPSQLQGGGQPVAAPSGGGQWWPAELGTPSSSGAQNDMRYAYFPDARRLAVQHHGRLSLYDTGEHRIAGVSQQQGGTRSLAFTGQHGPVSLDGLRRVEPGESRPDPSASPSPDPSASTSSAPAPSTPTHSASAPAPARTATGPADDPLTTIERLAELRQKGVLTEDEFAAAKAEQLRRL